MRAPCALLLAGLLLLVSACVVGPEPIAPALPTPEAFATSASFAASATSEPWWDGFSDPTLSTLINTALAGNLDIAVAGAQLREARALRRATSADLLPTLDAFIDSELAAILSGDAQADTEHRGGALLAFDTDLFGRNRRRIQAADALLAAAALNVEDVKRLVAQTIAIRYVELRRAGARLTLLETAQELQQRTLEIVQARNRAGLSPKLDVDRSAADLARTNAQRGLLLENRQNAEYALSVLLGEAPRANRVSAVAAGTIPAFAGGPPLGVPVDLLRRRPDVRAAEAQLIAEIAGVGVEIADLYPRLTLPGTIRAEQDDSGGIADLVSLNLSALLDLPFFDGGRRRAEVRAQQARSEAALLRYQQALLLSLQEVESALVRIANLLDRQAQLAESVALSRSAYEQLDALYREGLASFIDVLDIQRTLIASRENYVDSQAEVATAIVSLYAALGMPSG